MLTQVVRSCSSGKLAGLEGRSAPPVGSGVGVGVGLPDWVVRVRPPISTAGERRASGDPASHRQAFARRLRRSWALGIAAVAKQRHPVSPTLPPALERGGLRAPQRRAKGDRCLAYRPQDAGIGPFRMFVLLPRSKRPVAFAGAVLASDRRTVGLASHAARPNREERFRPPPAGTRAASYDEPRMTLAEALAAGARGARGNGNSCGALRRMETVEVPRALRNT